MDIARVMAMLYIITIWHAHDYIRVVSIPFGDLVKNACLGLFMFVSGYLLGGGYKIYTIRDVRNFAIKRFVRIYPLYAIALLSFWITKAIDLKTLVYSLTGLSTFLPPQPPTLWFVSMLLLFYVFFIFISKITITSLRWGVFFFSISIFRPGFLLCKFFKL